MAENSYFPPSEEGGGWRKNTDPEFVRSLGIGPDSLQEFLDYNLSVPSTTWPDPHYQYRTCLVIKDGWLIGEAYSRPEAQTFRQYTSSSGKAFAMALLGIVVEDGQKGEIPHQIGLDSKVYDEAWLPEGFPLSDERKSQITFRHILKHTSGLCPETDEDGRYKWTNFVDWLVGHDDAWPHTKPLYSEPGTREGYSSVGFGHLGLVIRNLYEVKAAELFEQRMLKPIGANKISYFTPVDNEGDWWTAGSVEIAPRDYARIAYLLLKDGRWGQEQIIPTQWVQHIRREADYPNLRSNVDGSYGGQYPKDMFRFGGSGLNAAFMIPSLDLVAMRTSRAPNSMRDEVYANFLKKLFAAVGS